MGNVSPPIAFPHLLGREKSGVRKSNGREDEKSVNEFPFFPISFYSKELVSKHTTQLLMHCRYYALLLASRVNMYISTDSIH